jgi:hypothetical protein
MSASFIVFRTAATNSFEMHRYHGKRKKNINVKRSQNLPFELLLLIL